MTSTRQRLPLPFGRGLDRDTGPMAAESTAQEDLRNTHLAPGFAHLRKGQVDAAECLDPDDDQPCDAVMAGETLKAQGIGVLIAWRESSRKVHVFRVSRAGENPFHVAEWFVLPVGAQEPPQFFIAEMAGQAFLAHDEPALSLREATVAYNPSAGTLTALTAAWAHEDGIRFRGVTAHLGAYLAGWGYGSEAEIRADLVRMSLPGEPATFELQHYESIGQRGDPVLRCLSTGRTLLCFKQFETWEHFGTDRRSFGKRQLDPMVGIVGSHAGLVVDSDAVGAPGTAYVFTHLGPRSSSGGPPQDLAIPLALFSPEPADLDALGPASQSFAAYLPGRRQVRFHFGTRYYAFDVVPRDWSYGELGVAARCAFLLPGVPADSADPGLAVGLAITSDVYGAAIDTRDVTVQWTNGSMVGDELLELWLQKDGEAWALHATIPVEAGDTQSYTFDELDANQLYRWQIRATRGGEPRATYDDADPDMWPANSLLEYTTASGAPTLAEITWDAEDEDASVVHLAWTGTDPTLATRVFRKVGAGAYALAATVGAGLLAYDYEPDFGAETGETLTFKVDHAGGVESNEETVELPTPPAPQAFAQGEPTNQWYQYDLTWSMADNMADLVTRVEDDYAAVPGGFADRGVTVANASTKSVSVEKESALDQNGNQPANCSARARHEVTIGITTFESPWRVINVDLEIAPDETAH